MIFTLSGVHSAILLEGEPQTTTHPASVLLVSVRPAGQRARAKGRILFRASSRTPMPVMGGLDQLMHQVAFMRHGKYTEGTPKQPMPQVWRSLIDDEGRSRQIQREPDGHYFRQDRHN
jgi:hypothetical protein